MLKVIGIGDNVVDIYTHERVMYPGGNALNFSVYAQKLGAEAAYLGILGNDEAAAHITHVLQEIGVDITHCRHYQGENGYAKVSLIDGDRVFTGGNQGGVSRERPIKLEESDFTYIQQFDLVHTSCYSYMEEEIRRLREFGIPISFDFSSDFDNEYLARVCPYVDFCFLSCSHLDDKDVQQLLKRIHQYGPQIVLATMGTRGAMLYHGEHFYTQTPEFVKPVDTLGAGDAFITAFLLNYVTHSNRAGHSDQQTMDDMIRESLFKGAVFASQACLSRGAFGYGKTVERR